MKYNVLRSRYIDEWQPLSVGLTQDFILGYKCNYILSYLPS